MPSFIIQTNNAGGALGMDAFEHADLDQWRQMYEANVLGTVRVTQALLPALERSGDGIIVVVGSIAGFEPYEGGAGYNAAKFAVCGWSEAMFIDLWQTGVAVKLVLPGPIDTEVWDQPGNVPALFDVEKVPAAEATAAVAWSTLSLLGFAGISDFEFRVFCPGRTIE